MISAPYTLASSAGPLGRLGLIVLQVDETIEGDFRRVFADPGFALYVTRIPSGADLTPDTIAAMEHDLPAASRLLPGAHPLDAVAYACTSGTAQIGAARVEALVRDNSPARMVTNPLNAALAAFDALGARSVGIVSPYVDAVSARLIDAFRAAGLNVPAAVSFGEEVEANVARISESAIRSAAQSVADAAAPDAVFLSCTNLRTFDLIEPLEQQLGCPVVSSNQVLAWHMAQSLTGCDKTTGPGQLFRLPFQSG